MKKFTALLIAAVMMLTALTGCSNAVYDDFQNFLNVEMVEVNANYDKLLEELAVWDTLEYDAEIAEFIKASLIPLVDDSLAKLTKINPETDEVKEIKAKYVKVMEAYKAAFEDMYTAFSTGDEAVLKEGNAHLDEGMVLLDEYNAALEALAAEVGAEIQY